MNTTAQVKSTMSLAFDSSGEGGVIVIEPPLMGSSRFSVARGRGKILVLRTEAPSIEWKVLECNSEKGVLRGRYTVLGASQEGEFQLEVAPAFTPKF